MQGVSLDMTRLIRSGAALLIASIAVVLAAPPLIAAPEDLGDDALPTTWVAFPFGPSRAVDINDVDVAVGIETLAEGDPVFTWDLTTGATHRLSAWRDDATTSELGATPSGINDSGLVVGSFDHGAGTSGFVWDIATGAVTEVGPGRAQDDIGLQAISDAGLAIGYSNFNEEFHTEHTAYAYDTVTGHGGDLALLEDGDFSNARDVSSTGSIVGEANSTEVGPTQAVYWDDLGVHTIEGAGPGSRAVGIDDAGNRITGSSSGEGAWIYDIATETLTSIPFAGDINDDGLILGGTKFYDVGTDTVTETSTLGTGGVSPYREPPELLAMNDHGTAVGLSYDHPPLLEDDGNPIAVALTRWTFADVPPWHPFEGDIT